MYAIVLSCDRYQIFAEHMVASYECHWPTNQFTFRVPYQVQTAIQERFREKVELVKTAVYAKNRVADELFQWIEHMTDSVGSSTHRRVMGGQPALHGP
jgi:hypothetical protein